MRFHNLPDIMNVGGAHLTPVSRLAPLDQYTCTDCGRVSLSVFVCSNQHVICKTCCVSESNNCIWCPPCAQTIIGREMRFSAETLAEFQFECACGFTGTLITMKRHLLERPTSGNPEGERRVCGTDAGPPRRLGTGNAAEEDPDDRMRNIAVEEIGKMKETIHQELIEGLSNNIAFELTAAINRSDNMKRQLEQKMEQQRNELVEKIETQNRDSLSQLNERIFSVMEDIHRVAQAVLEQQVKIDQCKEDIAKCKS